jgi:hypothetical protein
MSDPLSNLKFEESAGKFLKFTADVPLKIRVWSTDPVVHDNTYTDKKTGEISISTKYAFAVWNFVLGREQILDAGATITKAIAELHRDEEWGADITKMDLKITPTGELLERRYDVRPVPKAADLTKEQVTKLEALDASLDEEFSNGVRANQYNEGLGTDKVVDVNEDEPISLDDFPS